MRRRRLRTRVARWTALTGAGGIGLGLLMRAAGPGTPGREYWPYLIAGGAGLLVLVVGIWWSRRSGSAGRVTRWSARSNRRDGVASVWTIWRTAGRHAMRKKAKVLKPSLAAASLWVRLRTPTRAYATPLARVGMQTLYSPVEDVTVRIGGPRSGKSGELAGRILDAPGAVIATSTRTDLLELTGPVRSKRGPVHVFNPAGLGDVDSTISFDPLTGCQQPATATARAADLLSGTSSPGSDGDREFWADQARRVLASLLHAAALGGSSMRDVLAWVSDPDAHAGEVTRLLRRSEEAAYESNGAQFLALNDRTRSSICSTIMPALGWLTDATAAAATQPASGSDSGFEVAQLLAEHGTVFMLGAEEAHTAPLMTALTGHLAREARTIAARQRGGRLDPALTLALDEAAIICPIPLDSWTADMGGRNITIHIAVQGRSQLRQRWGADGAATILNNAATVLIYGGSRDPDDLQAYSTLTGERDEETRTHGGDGKLASTTVRRVPVLSPAQIAQLPFGHVLIIRRGMPPAVGRVAMGWKRADVRRQARADRRAAKPDTRLAAAWRRHRLRVEANRTETTARTRWTADTDQSGQRNRLQLPQQRESGSDDLQTTWEEPTGDDT